MVPRTETPRRRHGFTLVELLVVIAIIGVLVALLLPAVQMAREAANRSSCHNNAKQLGLALHNFHDTYKRFPPGAQQDTLAVPPPPTVSYFRGTSWLVFILPQMEQRNVYDQYDFSQPYYAAVNNPIGLIEVGGYKCPSGPRLRSGNANGGNEEWQGVRHHATHYYGVMGPSTRANPSIVTYQGIQYSYVVGDPATNGAFSTNGILTQYKDAPGSVTTKFFTRLADVTDGTSNTLMVGERSKHRPPGEIVNNDYRSWIRGQNGGSATTKNVTYPINSTDYNGSNNFNDISFGSAHTGGSTFTMADASVQFLSEAIEMELYQSLASMNSKEPGKLP